MMKKTKLLVYLILFTFCFSFVNCKKNKSIPDPQPVQSPGSTKSVKFEVTGNYSGYLSVVYNDNESGNTSVMITSLPWSKTIDYPASVVGVGIGGNGSTQNLGISGQTVSVKIYNASSIVRSGSAVADANGLINLPTLAYSFP